MSYPEDWEDHQADGTNAFQVESWFDPNQSHIKSLWAWPDPEYVPLQIAISGAAGTGKTKLAKAIGSELDLPVVSGVARTAHRLGFKLDKKSKWADQFAIFLAQAYEQMEYEEYVSAGCVIDITAHAHFYAENFGSKKDMTLVRALANMSNTIANNEYTVHFYLPYSRKPRQDGVRSTDNDYNKEIDRLVHFYLDAFDVDYFPVQGNANDKVLICNSYLEEFGLLHGR